MLIINIRVNASANRHGYKRVRGRPSVSRARTLGEFRDEPVLTCAVHRYTEARRPHHSQAAFAFVRRLGTRYDRYRHWRDMSVSDFRHLGTVSCTAVNEKPLPTLSLELNKNMLARVIGQVRNLQNGATR